MAGRWRKSLESEAAASGKRPASSGLSQLPWTAEWEFLLNSACCCCPVHSGLFFLSGEASTEVLDNKDYRTLQSQRRAKGEPELLLIRKHVHAEAKEPEERQVALTDIMEHRWRGGGGKVWNQKQQQAASGLRHPACHSCLGQRSGNSCLILHAAAVLCTQDSFSSVAKRQPKC